MTRPKIKGHPVLTYRGVFEVPRFVTDQRVGELIDKFQEAGSAKQAIIFEVEGLDLWDLRERLDELQDEIGSFGLGALDIDREGILPNPVS